MMAGPNDYELGYDEGYQDGTAVSHELAGLVTERDKWKARAEKAEKGWLEEQTYRIATEGDMGDLAADLGEWKARAEKAEKLYAEEAMKLKVFSEFAEGNLKREKARAEKAETALRTVLDSLGALTNHNELYDRMSDEDADSVLAALKEQGQ